MRLLIAALLLLTAACVQEPSVPKLGGGAVELKVAASADQIHVGEADTITVTAINNLDQQVRILFAVDPTCQILVYVQTSSARTVVPERDYSCIPIQSQLVIPSTGSVNRKFVWRGDTMLDPPGSESHLPAGDYYVTAIMRADGFTVPAFSTKVTLLP